MVEMVLNYDLFDQVIKYLDYNSIINLLNSCKLYYNYYNDNKTYISKILINKIFEYFYIPETKLSHLSQIEKYVLLKQLQYIFKYFYMHRTTKYVNMLHFMIENKNKFETNDKVSFLYKVLLDLCVQKRTNSNSESDNKSNKILDSFSCQSYVSPSDLKYLLIHTNKYQLQLLLEKFHVDSKTILLVLKELLSKRLHRHNNDKFDNNIVILIKYFFYKFSFNKTASGMTFSVIDTKFLYTIIELIIQSTRHKNYIFKVIIDLIKKYNIQINQFHLIEFCIISNNINAFKYLIKTFDTNNYSIMIRPYYIKSLLKNGHFDFLEYIIEKLLGQFINLDLYVQNLNSGILKFYENKNFIRTKTMQMEQFYHNICHLLSDSNQKLIQKSILSIFD
jgi:hypothetical protein